MRMLQKKYEFLFKNRDTEGYVIDDEDFMQTGKSGPKPFPNNITFDSKGTAITMQSPKLPRSLFREPNVEMPNAVIVEKDPNLS
jgi:hypothetical protein